MRAILFASAFASLTLLLACGRGHGGFGPTQAGSIALLLLGKGDGTLWRGGQSEKVVPMKPPIRTSLLAALALAALAASCGGKVVVDAPSGQGGQAGGGGASPTLPACVTYCDARVAAGCPMPGSVPCAAVCTTEIGYVGETCAAAAVALFDCRAKLPPDQLCAWKLCDPEQEQLMACGYPPGGCAAGECAIEGLGGIHCTKICSDNVYESTCVGTPESRECTCARNGVAVGTCTNTVGAPGACCMGIFASQ